MTAREHKEWTISFRRNIHMYRHDLRASNHVSAYQIPCEDSPDNPGRVLIWPYDLAMDANTYANLIAALHDWATEEGFPYRIYVSHDRFEPADSSPITKTDKPE